LSAFFGGSRSLNGVGGTAKGFVTTLEDLTLRQDLAKLTFLPWREVIPLRGSLLRSNRAWCPTCFEEMSQEGLPIYEPLIWNIKILSICPKHGNRLRDRCHHCNSKNFVLNHKSRPGFCSKCGQWLGENVEFDTIQELLELEWQIFIVRNLSGMLSYPQEHVSKLNRNILVGNVNTLIDHFTNGSVKAFSEKFNIKRTTLRSWLNASKLPCLKSLFEICYMTGNSVCDLMLNPSMPISNPRNAMPMAERTTTRRPKKSDVGPEVEKHLRHTILRSGIKSPPMTEVARELGYSKYLLCRHYPELCLAISENHRRFKRVCKENKLQNICERVKEAIVMLSASGIYPSRAKVEDYLQKPGIFFDKTVRNTWRTNLTEILNK